MDTSAYWQSVIKEIDKFSKKCRETECTDTDEAQELLDWIHGLATDILAREETK